MPTVVVAIVAIALGAGLTILWLRRAPERTADRTVERHAVRERGPAASRAALESSGRTRAGQSRPRHQIEPARSRLPRRPVLPDDEAIGVSRREFLNRSLLATVAFMLAGAGSATLAFLWPSSTGASGFGGKIQLTGLAKILAQIEQSKAPFYVPDARTWLQQYPASALPKAANVYSPAIFAGMRRGVVALYQTCPHLGCRVPWCQSSQWFECPCHGSKYNAVGEKTAGPAPRGMDRFPVIFSGDTITIDTGNVILGPPIGTDTTGQHAEGPLCV